MGVLVCLQRTGLSICMTYLVRLQCSQKVKIKEYCIEMSVLKLKSKKMPHAPVET